MYCWKMQFWNLAWFITNYFNLLHNVIYTTTVIMHIKRSVDSTPPNFNVFARRKFTAKWSKISNFGFLYNISARKFRYFFRFYVASILGSFAWLSRCFWELTFFYQEELNILRTQCKTWSMDDTLLNHLKSD